MVDTTRPEVRQRVPHQSTVRELGSRMCREDWICVPESKMYNGLRAFLGRSFIYGQPREHTAFGIQLQVVSYSGVYSPWALNAELGNSINEK